MIKIFSKILLIALVIFVMASSSLMCLAEEDYDHTTTPETNDETPSSETASTQDEIHTGDLYLIGNEVIMDKLVDGNVFIIGNNVKITGQVNGNLFVLANNVTFDSCIINYSIFACASYVNYNDSICYSGDLYVAANKFESTYNSIIARDIKAIASYITLNSEVYRNVDLISNHISLGEGENIPAIHGNLNYTSSKELSIPEGILIEDGTTTYTPTHTVENILISLGTVITTTLVLYIILNKLTPKFIEKVNNNNFSFITLLKAFGIGLATIAIVILFIVLLAGTMVGLTLAAILALLFVILYIVATPMLTLKITNVLKNKLQIEKNYMFYIVLVLVSIILYGITLIPFVGVILNLIINITAIGLIVNVFLPHKELSEEKKLAIQQAKENKEKKKQEKLEAKAAKKQEKLENKNSRNL